MQRSTPGRFLKLKKSIKKFDIDVLYEKTCAQENKNIEGYAKEYGMDRMLRYVRCVF
ncbi:MAG: hypothetical protein ABI045_00375 [Flavobacteriales bacterium]